MATVEIFYPRFDTCRVAIGNKPSPEYGSVHKGNVESVIVWNGRSLAIDLGVVVEKKPSGGPRVIPGFSRPELRFVSFLPAMSW